ncbi:MAG: hypothetical protein RL336_194 [Pseudomonadota bacterium]|jgi:GntR family transcriptional regulator
MNKPTSEMFLSKSFQPLYKQVYDVLTKRLVDGYWKPSEVLPSEMALADELGVSQGTVRKALNQMVSEQLLERRQGKGTYVAEHTSESSLTRFFRLREPKGQSLFPETVVLGCERRQPLPYEVSIFNLDGSTEVVEWTRLRDIGGEPVVYEKVVQPLSIFPNIDKEPNLPNALYILYQEKYGISIISVQDELRAIGAASDVAKALDMKAGEPVMMIERQSKSLDGRVVEFSQAYCRTDKFIYSVELK